MKEFKLYINGQWIDSEDGKTFVSYHKANGQEVNRFAAATVNEVDRACRAARAAFPLWSGLDGDRDPPGDRVLPEVSGPPGDRVLPEASDQAGGLGLPEAPDPPGSWNLPAFPALNPPRRFALPGSGFFLHLPECSPRPTDRCRSLRPEGAFRSGCKILPCFFPPDSFNLSDQ